MERRPEGEVMDVSDEVEAYVRADFSQVNQAFVDRLIQLVKPPLPDDKTGRMLAVDLGAGPADIPIRLMQSLPGAMGPSWRNSWHIIAVDASAPMLDAAGKAIAQAGLSTSIETRHCDAKDTRLPYKSFDVIFSNSILHHVADAAAFWREVKRLAKSGATLLIRDLVRPLDEAAARKIVQVYAGDEPPLLQEEYHRSLLAAYTVDEIKAQLEHAGLGQLKAEMVSDRHWDVWGRM